MSIHLIYHVPKCAGRTIDCHLAAALPPQAYTKLSKPKGLKRFLSASVPREALDPDQTRVVVGHFLPLSTDAVFAGQELKRSILLREPIGHIISHYNFRMMRYLARGRHSYSFELDYRARRKNFISHYILRNFLEMPWHRLARLADDEKYDIVNAFLARFWYVADFSRCDELIAALAATLEIPERASPQNTEAEWAKRVKWRPFTMSDLSSDAVARIRQDNLIDQRLWETWHEAKHDGASVRPLTLGGTSSRGFITTEATRFVNRVVRRIERRWGIFNRL
jgi:hypothetical protein